MRTALAAILLLSLPTLVVASPAQAHEATALDAPPGATSDTGPSGLWFWTKPEVVVLTPVVTLRPGTPRTTEPATLQVGPLREGYLDWTADMPSAVVGCRLGKPVYGPKLLGFVTSPVEVPGYCTIRSTSNSQWTTEWHASLLEADSVVGVRLGLARGDGSFR